MRTRILRLLVPLVAVLSACGQTSFFEVAVSVKPDPMITIDSLRQIDSCQVTVTGATTDSFALDNCQLNTVHSYQIGIFQYGTDKDSGTVNFQVKLVGVDKVKVLGTGAVGAAIISGGRQTTAVEVVPDPTQFLGQVPL